MERATRMPWAMVAVLYAFGLLGMSLVGVLSPLAGRVTAALGAPKEAIGLTIALFSLPPAIIATFGGSVIDRIGPRRILMLAPPLLIATDLILALSPSIWLTDFAMLVAGFGYVGLVVAVPAALMNTLDGAIRARAMAFWSTHAPAGFSAGLLLAVPFTGAIDWRLAFLIHAGLVAVALVAAALLLPAMTVQPETGALESVATRLSRLFRAVREPAAVRLALALAMPNMISYGTSLSAVGYLSRMHNVSLAASATTVAAAKIAAIVFGGTVIGALLARNLPPRRLFVAVILSGIVAQVLLYLPASPLPLAVAGLMLWLFSFGGQCGVCMAMMPALAQGDLKGGTLAGFVNQAISIVSFLTPALYFAISGWTGFVALAIGGSLISLVALPTPRRTVASSMR